MCAVEKTRQPTSSRVVSPTNTQDSCPMHSRTRALSFSLSPLSLTF